MNSKSYMQQIHLCWKVSSWASLCLCCSWTWLWEVCPSVAAEHASHLFLC